MIYIYTFFEVRIIGVPFVLLVGDEHQVWLFAGHHNQR